jgi:hypothetical protein
VPLLSGRTPARAVALWAFLFHSVAVGWLWWRFGESVRGGVAFWMDLPLSLLWAGAEGGALLAASLLVGGLWWAALAAAFAYAVGRIVRGR